MKLYEFSAIISVGVVVYAESEEQARAELDEWSAATWYHGGDVSDEVSDIDLIDERELVSDDPEDEAHVILSEERR